MLELGEVVIDHTRAISPLLQPNAIEFQPERSGTAKCDV